VILHQPVSAEPGDETAEASPGVDRRELLGVPDQHHLCPAALASSSSRPRLRLSAMLASSSTTQQFR
jgi:hypothetical protein